MKSRLSVIAIALSTLVAGHALAADPSVAKTREQVRAEFVEAQRNGDLIANGESGARFNQLYPHLYAQPVTAGKSRAEVKAELAAAQASGDLIANGETGARFNELFPQQFAARGDVANTVEVAAQGKTREQVKAELAEAIRTGDMVAVSESGTKFNQLYPNRYPQPTLAQGVSRDDVRAELENSSSVKAN